MTEEIFISEIHNKIIDMRDLVTLSNEVALLCQYESERIYKKGEPQVFETKKT